MPRPYTAAFLLVLLTGSFLTSVGRAQSVDQPMPGYVAKRWTTTDGLPHNSIVSLLQTRDGYLWIGTTRGGLVRFDGVTFTTFSVINTPALTSDWVAALYEDREGTLWIGTEAGLVRYRDGVFTPEPLGDDAPPGLIVDIRPDRDGRLWVAAVQRVVRRDGDRWTFVTSGASTVHPLSASADGTMWIATNHGVIEWRDGIVRRLTTRDGLPSDLVYAVHEDRGGRVWIATDRGLAHVDRREDARVEQTVLADVPTTSLFEDSSGRLWIGAVGRFSVRHPDGTLSVSVFGSEAEASEARVFTEDRDGQIWFGVVGGTGGLYRLAPRQVTTLSSADGLPCDNIGPLTQAADGTIWLATHCVDGRGVAALREGRAVIYAGPAYVSALLADSNGAVWGGTFDGRLWRLQEGRFVEMSSPTAEPKEPIAALYGHTDGALWIGTNRGVLRRGPDGWTRLRTSDGLVSDEVISIVGDPDGALWISTKAGVSRYHDGHFTNYGAAEGVPPGVVRAVHAAADGIVWIGTYGGGLARLRDGKIFAYGSRAGVLDSSVHRILEDGDFLWLTGDHGIRRVSKRELNAIAEGQTISLNVTLYDETNGMRSAECNGMGQPAGWRTRDGRLYVPTQRGIVGIDPTLAGRGTLPAPTPRIEDTIIDGASSALGPELVVEAGYRDVEIRYTAAALARPEQVQFRYQLEGHSAGWTEVGTRRVASFASLPPGGYRFLVAARHADGAWSETPAAVALVLQPYFYQRLGFQLLVVALALGVALGAGRWYIVRLRLRAEHLERTVAERTADLSRAHEGLSTAHESLGRAKHEVEQAHGQVLAVLNQLDIGVLILTAAGVVRYASVSAQRVLNKGEQDLLGRPWFTCLPVVESDRPRVRARMETLSPAAGHVPVQMVIGGKRHWAELDIRDEPPPGDGRILYLYNVTEVSTPPAHMGEGFHGLVGRSTAMRLLHKQIRDLARVDSTVLIHGETGVGKELVARAIHRESRRADHPFVAVNAAGLSESLLTSQLFGHRRGAFTGAVDDQMGLFEAAHGGTLFLDEIGDMPLNVQTSLLRVLQEREITRLGESHARQVDVRFLAATHRDLAREVEEGRFREDLRYRVHVATIAVPPLRERLDDVPLLVDAFLAREVQPTGRPMPHVSRDAMDTLLGHTWPGNVRELRAVIDRALVTAQGDIVHLDDLPVDIVAAGALEPADAIVNGPSERERLLEALRRAGGNRTEAARLLGISRRTIYRKLAEHGLDNESDR